MDYHKVGILRNKPGRGDRTISLSCSDKIMKWNIFGLQGTLLFAFLSKPLYLTSIVVGELYHQGALHRALVERIQPLKSLLPEVFQTVYQYQPQSQFQSLCTFYRSAESFEFGKQIVEEKLGIEKTSASSYGIKLKIQTKHFELLL